MAKINGKSVNVSFDGVNGYSIDGLWYHSIGEVREKIENAQKAIKDLLDLSNGENNMLLTRLFKESYDFYYNGVLGSLIADTPSTVHSGNGKVTHYDFSDVPFIRSYDDDFGFRNFTFTDSVTNAPLTSYGEPMVA